MKLGRYIVPSVFFLISLSIVFSALAGFEIHPNYVFNDMYGTAGTKLDATVNNGCLICHFVESNPYGADIYEYLRECFETSICDEATIEGAIRNVEPFDSDGDGYNNITEINNLTFPGDLNDHPSAQWAKAYGGSGQDWADSAESIRQTSDSGYVVIGDTDSFGASYTDFWVLKLDADGNVQWQKTYGGSSHDYSSSIQQTSDNGYIVAGITLSSGAGNYDVWVLKLDINGNVQWQKTYGGSGDDEAYSIQQTSDNGYIVAGYTCSFGAGYSDVWVLKLGTNGDVLWQKTYGGISSDWAESIQQTSDGGYIVAGVAGSFGAGNGDFWVLKLDSYGTVDWQKTYGGNSFDRGRTIQQTSDGGYIVGGMTESFGAGGDAWELKLNSSGNVIWQKTYGGSNFEGATIRQTSDSSYIMAGRTASFGAGGDDLWALKLDSNGNVIWQKTYGGSGNEFARFIQQTSGGGYIVGGFTNSFGAGNDDLWILKLDGNGEIPGCSAIETSNATVTDTSATIINTTITGVDTSVSPQTSSATPADINAMVTEVCYYAGSEEVTVLNPNGGEEIPSGSTYTIRWGAPPEAVKFDLLYSLNNGTTWITVANKVAGTSCDTDKKCYNWKVPKPLANKKKCLVKVIGYDASDVKVGEDASDATFTIEVVKVTSPDGGETLRPGNTWTLTWQTNGTKRRVAKVRLFYTINGGNTWTRIKILTGNPGSYNWTVPNVSSSICKVKVVLKDSGGVTVGSDVSDGVFTIQP